MYYVFLETIDKNLSTRIAKINCPQIVKKLVEDYMAFIKQECGLIDNEQLQKYFEDEGRNIILINCYLLLNGGCCAKPDCCTNHTTVLVSEQVEIFSGLMRDSIKDTQKLSNQNNNNELERAGLQRAFQTY